jgi:hypothetical protein
MRAFFWLIVTSVTWHFHCWFGIGGNLASAAGRRYMARVMEKDLTRRSATATPE